ncbi:MAG: hypothetical protein ACRDRK_15865, partial [Pseudonocardia sp.]
RSPPMTRTQDHHQRATSNTHALAACRGQAERPPGYGITECLPLKIDDVSIVSEVVRNAV